jgi:hypothetical protein
MCLKPIHRHPNCLLKIITYAVYSSDVLLLGKGTVSSVIRQGFTAEGTTNVTRTGGHPVASMAFVIYNVVVTHRAIWLNHISGTWTVLEIIILSLYFPYYMPINSRYGRWYPAHILEALISNLALCIHCSESSSFSSDPPGEWQHGTLKQATAASSNSVVIPCCSFTFDTEVWTAALNKRNIYMDNSVYVDQQSVFQL